MKEDSSLPKTAGPQVQDGAKKAVLTDYETDLARHALGLPNKRRRSYRNRFIAGPGHTDFLAWEGLVSGGLAVRRKWSLISETESVYILTRAGAEAALVLGESLDTEDGFPDPTIKAEGPEAPEEQGSTRSGEEHLPPLRDRIAVLEEIVRGFLSCAEIADCAPEDKEPETDALERKARAALSNQGRL